MSEYIDLDVMDVELRLSWPPSVNNYYGHSAHGVHLKKTGRLFRDEVSKEVARQVGGKRINERPICMTVVLFQPDRRARDLDNHMKALLDAIEASQLIMDDAWIDYLQVFRGEVVKGGLTVVKISAGVEDLEQRGVKLKDIDLVLS